MPAARSTSTRRRNRPAAAAAPISTRATNLTIDNGNHLLLSGNHHALAYARAIGTEAGLVGPPSARISIHGYFHGPAMAARSRRRPAADLGVRRSAPRSRYRRVRLSETRADHLGRRGQARRRYHSVRGHAVSASGAAAVARGAQLRSAGRLGRTCRCDRAGNVARGRTGLPAADRARWSFRRAGRARRQTVAGQGRQRAPEP